MLSIHIESTLSSAACVMRTSLMVSYISSMISRQGLFVVSCHTPINNFALDLDTYGGKSSFTLCLGGVGCFISEYCMYLLPLMSNLSLSSTELFERYYERSFPYLYLVFACHHHFHRPVVLIQVLVQVLVL